MTISQCACGAEVARAGDVCGKCPAPAAQLLDPFATLPCPKARPCDRCGAPTFERLCEACAASTVSIEQRFDALRTLDETIPDNFARLEFESPRVARIEPAAVKAAFAFLDAPDLVFKGNSGAGKTTLAITALRQRVRRRGDRAIFVPAWRLGVARIQHAAGDGEAKLVERAMNAPLVLLDDVGSERATATNAVPDVILARAEEGRPTWITTWLEPKDAGQLYGGGVARRIFDTRLIRMNALARAAGGGS